MKCASIAVSASILLTTGCFLQNLLGPPPTPLAVAPTGGPQQKPAEPQPDANNKGNSGQGEVVPTATKLQGIPVKIAGNGTPQIGTAEHAELTFRTFLQGQDIAVPGGFFVKDAGGSITMSSRSGSSYALNPAPMGKPDVTLTAGGYQDVGIADVIPATRAQLVAPGLHALYVEKQSLQPNQSYVLGFKDPAGFGIATYMPENNTSYYNNTEFRVGVAVAMLSKSPKWAFGSSQSVSPSFLYNSKVRVDLPIRVTDLAGNGIAGIGSDFSVGVGGYDTSAARYDSYYYVWQGSYGYSLYTRSAPFVRATAGTNPGDYTLRFFIEPSSNLYSFTVTVSDQITPILKILGL